MTDALLTWGGDVYFEEKLRVNHHGWVEHHRDGSVIALTPPHKVDHVFVGIERFEDGEDDE